MSDVKFIVISLLNLFESKRGNSLYTKNYCNSHKGEYEVFTGTTIGSFGFIDTYDYDLSNLTYTTDGEYAGTVNILKGQYNVGGHRALLKPIVDNLCLEYFSFILEPIFKSIIIDGSVPSITWNIIKNATVSLPIKEDGSYDLVKQKEIVDKYKVLEKQKMKLIERRISLNDAFIAIDLSNINVIYTNVKLIELFKLKRGNSKYTKTYCHEQSGLFPVYSANNKVPLAFANFYDYDGEYLTTSVNGIACKVSTINEKFSLNADRVIFIPIIKNLDYDFIKYTIEPILRSNVKGRKGHDGQNEFTKLHFGILETIEINMPIKIDGSYDLEAQKEIANRYKKIEEIRKGICNKIDKLINIKMVLD